MLWKLQYQDCVTKYVYQSGCCTTAAQSLNVAEVACMNWGSCANTALYKVHTRLLSLPSHFRAHVLASWFRSLLTLDIRTRLSSYNLCPLKQPLQLRSNGHCGLWAPHIALTHNKGLPSHNKGLPSFNTSAHAKGARMEFIAYTVLRYHNTLVQCQDWFCYATLRLCKFPNLCGKLQKSDM